MSQLAADGAELELLEDRRCELPPSTVTSSTACIPAGVVSAARRSRSGMISETGVGVRRGRRGSALLEQAAGLGGAELLPFLDDELDAFSGHRGGL